jgi:hypothetical protein
MPPLTELEILGAGFLQRWRVYGAGNIPKGISTNYWLTNVAFVWNDFGNQ